MRIGNAENEAIYLLAKVEVVATCKLAGINRTRMENLFHQLFAPARLDITINDRFGRPELSALTRQCLSRRIGTIEKMASEVAAWDQARNLNGVRVNWRFSEQARTKLHRVYPQPQT